MDNILILGAGYAGMMAAHHLDRISEPFTIVNRNPYHYFTTLLHEAAGGRGTVENYMVPLDKVLRKPSSQVVVDEVLEIRRADKVVVTKQGERRYNWLVIALGWVSEYFGIPGLKENSMSIQSLETAEYIRAHIEEQFKGYVTDPDPRRLRIIVGGAGLTGIEFVGELMDWLPQLCTRYGIDRSLVDVQNIEAMPTILPMVAEPLRERAMHTLQEKGAKLRINTKLVKVEENKVYLDGYDPVEAFTIVWTGGVRANPLLEAAGFTVDRRGRAQVNAYLQSVDDDHVFIGGDSAWAEDANGKPLPPTAQVATQQGSVLANNVSSLAHGQAMKPFEAHLQGTLASLGRDVGVGDVLGVKLQGLPAGLMKEATKVKYLWQLGGFKLMADKSGELVHL